MSSSIGSTVAVVFHSEPKLATTNSSTGEDTKMRPFKTSLLIIALVVAPLAFTGVGRADDETVVRWDIISVDFAAGTVSAGGNASAKANDGSTITVTGSGTFGASAGNDDVTGGGTWQTSSPAASGTYQVTRLVRFDVAPGTFPPLTDKIGNAADARAGLVVLSIRYSDGSRGILVVSCELNGTPHSVFEGITASKGFVDYWNRVSPASGVDANRTAFHVVKGDD
jgi:hypothetical protein